MIDRIVLTLGTFDLLHVGHLNLIDTCRRIAGRTGRVVVGLNSDQFIEKYKGEYPVMSFYERARILGALRGVDQVIANPAFEQQRATIERGFAMGLEMPLTDRFLVIGTDWAAKDYYAQLGITRVWLEERSIQLLYIPYTEGISSTKLRRHLADLD